MNFFRFSIAGLCALVLAGCTTPSQIWLDARLSKLCAIDGGVTVYEVVPLPSSKFDEYGFINFFRPTQEQRALGEEFIWDFNYVTLVPGSKDSTKPRLTRLEIKISRRSDGKLLGHAVSYSRVGGDFANPGQPTSKTCPELADDSSLLKRLFVPMEAR